MNDTLSYATTELNSNQQQERGTEGKAWWCEVEGHRKVGSDGRGCSGDRSHNNSSRAARDREQVEVMEEWEGGGEHAWKRLEIIKEWCVHPSASIAQRVMVSHGETGLG